MNVNDLPRAGALTQPAPIIVTRAPAKYRSAAAPQKKTAAAPAQKVVVQKVVKTGDPDLDAATATLARGKNETALSLGGN